MKGTVRSESKGKYLVKLFNTDRFSYVVVEDSVAPNAFDEAVRGCEGVMHTASPFQ